MKNIVLKNDKKTNIGNDIIYINYCWFDSKPTNNNNNNNIVLVLLARNKIYNNSDLVIDNGWNIDENGDLNETLELYRDYRDGTAECCHFEV